MKTLLLCLLTTSCMKSAAFSTSSLGGGGDGNVTIPDVFKLKKADAIAALRKSGVEGDIDDDDSLCGSTVDGKLIELGEVCYQHPAAGQRQGARLVVSLRVQSEDPRHGDIGRNTEWRLMPNVIGMTYEQAVVAMKRAGFEREDRIDRAIGEDAGCKPNLVCREYPDVMTRAGINDGKVLFVGAAPEPAHVAVAEPTTTRSEPGPAPSPTPTPTPTAKPKPAADQPAAPLFGAPPPAPPAAPPPVAKDEPKSDTRHAGGNGAPPYRDSDGRVRGPGGPGKPVVFFVEEGSERFLDSEYEMLTSSRWSVGVVEAAGPDGIRIKGWGLVPMDTVRRIVEETPP